MLYKKYHRNYIRQFKKGTKFKFFMYEYNSCRKERVCEIDVEPFIEKLDFLLRSIRVKMKGDDNIFPVFTTVIYYAGQLITKDVIQKIS